MPRAKIRLQASEMFDAVVDKVSLVTSGANRQPFRKLASEIRPTAGGDAPDGVSVEAAGAEGAAPKEGYHVLNFRRIFKLGPAPAPVASPAPVQPDPKPALLAVAVAEGGDIEAVKATLQKAGLSAEKTIASDGATLFVQGEADPAAAPEEGAVHLALKLSDHVVAICKVFKQFVPFPESTSFSENMASAGFFPGFEVAQMVLRDTIFTIARSAGTQEDMRKSTDKAVKEFGSTISNMIAALPGDVFKLEEAMSGIEQPVAAAATEPKKTEATVEKTDAAPAPAADAPVTEENPVLKAVETLTAQLTTMGTSLEGAIKGVEVRVGALEGRVQKAEGDATRAVEAVRGTIGGASNPDPEQVPAKKAEGQYPLLDTGMARVHKEWRDGKPVAKR